MSLALLLFLTSLSNVHGVWNWTHPVQEAFLADGILMTSNHMKFKRLKETYDAVGCAPMSALSARDASRLVSNPRTVMPIVDAGYTISGWWPTQMM